MSPVAALRLPPAAALIAGGIVLAFVPVLPHG
jgi:hypothetical protein